MNRRDFIIGTASLSVASQSVSASDERQPSSQAQNGSEGVQIAGSHCSTCERMRELLRKINHRDGGEDERRELRWLGYVPGHYHSKEENCLLEVHNYHIDGMNYKFDVREEDFNGGWTFLRATVLVEGQKNPWVEI